MKTHTLDRRVEVLEQKVEKLEMLPDRVTALEVQISEFRAEVRAEFSATRTELRGEMRVMGNELRGEIAPRVTTFGELGARNCGVRRHDFFDEGRRSSKSRSRGLDRDIYEIP